MPTVMGDKTPGEGASAIHLEGVASLQVSKAELEATSKQIDFEKGAKFEFGPYAFKISKVGEPDWGDGWEMTLDTKTDPVSIKRWLHIGTGGKESELKESMNSSFGKNYQQSLRADEPLEGGSLKVEYWDSPEVVSAPFRFDVGLGL